MRAEFIIKEHKDGNRYCCSICGEKLMMNGHDRNGNQR